MNDLRKAYRRMSEEGDYVKQQFWRWVELRQDARQWSEDEQACAELAWRAAVESYDNCIQAHLKSIEDAIDRQLGAKLGA
jgi:hypothetical protein